jgi:hypothetical protein
MAAIEILGGRHVRHGLQVYVTVPQGSSLVLGPADQPIPPAQPAQLPAEIHFLQFTHPAICPLQRSNPAPTPNPGGIGYNPIFGPWELISLIHLLQGGIFQGRPLFWDPKFDQNVSDNHCQLLVIPGKDRADTKLVGIHFLYAIFAG